MKVALAHDYLNSWGGGERVLKIFKENLYPQADIYAITYDPQKMYGQIKYHVKTSFLQHVPFAVKYHKWFLPVMPLAVSRLKLEGYNLILSDSSGFIKGVKAPPGALHVCYIHTPTRYLTLDQEYFKASVPRLMHWLMPPLINYLKKQDLKGATYPDIYIANSQETAQRVKKYYHRNVDAVIFPPVDTKNFFPKEADQIGDYYLVAGRLAPYKRFDLAIQACQKLGKRLVVVGEGPEMPYLRSLSGPLVEFRGRVSDSNLRDAYASCLAMLFPPLEDAGMTPLECMACGRPVIAYNKGGAKESIVSGKTGLFFDDQTVDSLVQAIQKFEKNSWDSKEIVTHAEQFNTDHFVTKIKTVINQALAQKEASGTQP